MMGGRDRSRNVSKTSRRRALYLPDPIGCEWPNLGGFVQQLVENCAQEGYAEAVIDWIDSTGKCTLTRRPDLHQLHKYIAAFAVDRISTSAVHTPTLRQRVRCTLQRYLQGNTTVTVMTPNKKRKVKDDVRMRTIVASLLVSRFDLCPAHGAVFDQRVLDYAQSHRTCAIEVDQPRRLLSVETEPILRYLRGAGAPRELRHGSSINEIMDYLGSSLPKVLFELVFNFAFGKDFNCLT